MENACPGTKTRTGVPLGSGGLAFHRIVIAETGVAVVAALQIVDVVLAAFTILAVIAGHRIGPAGTAVPLLRRRGQLLRRQSEQRAGIDEGAVLEARDNTGTC